MEIERGTAVLWRGPGVVQIGSDPDQHVVLDGLSPAEQVWLVDAARRHADLGPPPGRTGHRPTRRAPHPWTPTPAAARVAARLRAGGSPPGAERQRTRRPPCVRIDGVDVVSAATARILVRAGVERLDIVDPARIERTVPDLFDDRDLGVSRARALTRRLRDLGPLTVEPLEAPDVVLVSRERVPDLTTAGVLRGENRVHLLLTRHEDAVEIGPLVVPGRTPCAQCRALHLADADPHWPLTAREMPFWPLSPAPGLAVETVASLEVARALLGVLGHTELGPSPLVDARGRTLLRVEAGGVTRRVPCPPHPRCSCGCAPQGSSPAAFPSSVAPGSRPPVGSSPRTTARSAAP